jgi:hypothetical protein
MAIPSKFGVHNAIMIMALQRVSLVEALFHLIINISSLYLIPIKHILINDSKSPMSLSQWQGTAVAPAAASGSSLSSPGIGRASSSLGLSSPRPVPGHGYYAQPTSLPSGRASSLGVAGSSTGSSEQQQLPPCDGAPVLVIAKLVDPTSTSHLGSEGLGGRKGSGGGSGHNGSGSTSTSGGAITTKGEASVSLTVRTRYYYDIDLALAFIIAPAFGAGAVGAAGAWRGVTGGGLGVRPFIGALRPLR